MQGFKPASASREDMPAKPPAAPPTKLLGAGAAAQAAGFLRGRKAQIDAASNFADGGMVRTGPDSARDSKGWEWDDQSKMSDTSAAIRREQAGEIQRETKRSLSRTQALDASTKMGNPAKYADGGMVKDYMDGGMVSGPGTGTSDSIKAKVPVGSYVMPADSTKAMGFKPKARQINVSDGEMIFNPKQVQAIGMKKLDKINDATHTPAPMTSTSTNFREGGLVDEDELKRRPSIPGMTVSERQASTADMRQFARDPGPGNPRVTAAGSPEANAFRQSSTVAPTSAPARSPGGFIPAAQRVLSTPAGAAGKWAGRALAPVGALVEGVNTAEVAANPNATGLDVATQAAGGAGKLAGGFLGAKGGAAAGAALGALGGPLAPITVPAGAVLGGIAGGVGGYMGAGKLIEAGRGMVGTETQDPVARLPAGQPQAATQATAAPAIPVSDPSQPQIDAGVNTAPAVPTPANQTGAIRRIDRPGEAPMFTNLADDQQGFAPGFTGRPNARNNAAAEALASRSAGRAPLVQAAGVNEGGGNITPFEESTGGFGILDKGYQDRRAAMMDAASLKPGARTALAALLRQQGEAPRLELERDTLAARREENAADRGMRSEEAQADRALKSQELGDAMATNAVRREAAGFEVSQARQLQALQNEYLTADTDEKRQAALKKLQALSGKQAPAEWGVQVTPGVKNMDGSTTEGSVYRFNKATGQVERVDGGRQSSQPLPNHVAALKANPSQAALFDQKYGPGAAAAVLGQQ